MCKIVAKLLAKRLKKVMPDIIDERKSAFIGGKHLLHNIVIANEAVKEAKRCQKPCMVFKVDYERHMILSLSSASDPLVALDGKVPNLVLVYV